MSDTPEPAPTSPSRDPEPEPDVAALRREAAARRRQLREVEAERDHLRERVLRQEKGQVEAIASELGFRSMEDVGLFLGDRAHVLDEHGFLDPNKAREALSALAENRPYLVARPEPEPQPEPQRRQYPDLHGGARTPPAAPPPSFGDLLKGA